MSKWKLRNKIKNRKQPKTMTEKLRGEIMAIMMILFSLTLIGILIAINVINYTKSTREEKNALQFYFESRQEQDISKGKNTNTPEEKTPKSHPDPEQGKLSRFSSYPLFYGKYSKDATLLSMEKNHTDTFSEEKVEPYFILALKAEQDHGIIEGFRYWRRPTPFGYDIALMDCRISQTNRRVLLFSTILLGIVSIFAFALFSFFLSGLVVKPVKEAFQRQNDFICAASHELKTPLAVILSNSELLLDQYGKNKWLTYIQSECDQMSKLITSLLTLTRLEQDNGWETQAALCNLSDAVSERILPFESMIYEKGLQFEYDITPDITIVGIREQLQQVLSILLDNALCYVSPNGSIRITLEKNGHNAILTVSNTGKEIALENRDKIFDRFYREDKARSRENGHYGLGLSIARSIICEHHGNIHVYCQDGLTSFVVTLPL